MPRKLWAKNAGDYAFESTKVALGVMEKVAGIFNTPIISIKGVFETANAVVLLADVSHQAIDRLRRP